MNKLIDALWNIIRFNRRAKTRTRSWNLVRFVQADGHGADGIGNLRNISQEGIQFSSESSFTPETHLSMIVNLVRYNRSMPIRVKVLWVKEEDQGYLSGASIDYVSPVDRIYLQEMVGRSS